MRWTGAIGAGADEEDVDLGCRGETRSGVVEPAPMADAEGATTGPRGLAADRRTGAIPLYGQDSEKLDLRQCRMGDKTSPRTVCG